jgi:hypothetical protein
MTAEVVIACSLVRTSALVKYILLHGKESRDSAVGIATCYGLDGRSVGVRAPVRIRFSLLHVFHTGSGAHPTSYPIGTGTVSPEVKRRGCEADHSPPPSAEVKNLWI